MKKQAKIILLAITLLSLLCLSMSGCGIKVQKGELGPTQTTSVVAPTHSDNEPTTEVPMEVLSGIESSYEALLIKGDTGVCEFYEPSNELNQKVNIRVNTFTRGENAKNIVEEYMKKNPSVTISELPSATVEYAVVDYEMSLSPDYQMDSKKSFPLIKMNIKGTNGEALEFDNAIYTKLSSIEILNPGTIKQGEIITLRSVFAIPINCTEYVLEFGAESGQKALFKGE